MDELHDLQTTLDAVLNLQREQDMRKLPSNYIRDVYNGLLRFMQVNNYTALNADFGLEYGHNRNGRTNEMTEFLMYGKVLWRVFL